MQFFLHGRNIIPAHCQCPCFLLLEDHSTRLHCCQAVARRNGSDMQSLLFRAMQFNGADLHGRQVKVSYAQRKK